MNRIDSPTDVALTQYEGEPDDTTREVILKAAASILPPIGLAVALRDHFSSRTRFERIKQVFLALRADIELLQKNFAQDRLRVQVIDERLKSPGFTEAVLTAAEEATRTADRKKLERLGSVLANGLDPAIIEPEDDLSSLVRDVSELSELDIKTLKIIFDIGPMQVLFENFQPKTTDIGLGQKLINAAATEKIENDDFYSTAYRLVGFGLALEVPSQSGRRSANDLRFIPTKRGRKLVALLAKRS